MFILFLINSDIYIFLLSLYFTLHDNGLQHITILSDLLGGCSDRHIGGNPAHNLVAVA